MKVIEVACPHCKKKFNYYESEFRPFCTEKCRLIDLGAWLDQSYAVKAEKITEEELQELEELVYEKNKESH